MIAWISMFFLSMALAGAADPVVYRDFAGCCLSPVFIDGYLLHMLPEENPQFPPQTLAVYGPEGLPAYQTNVTAPDGSPARLRQSGVAVDSDGTVALALWYGDCCSPPHSRGGAIAFISPQGIQTRTVDTGRYHPDALTFGADHSLWTAGTLYQPSAPRPAREYFIVRHFSPEGLQVGAFLSRSSFPAGLPPSGSGISFMRTAKDRVGLMAYPGMVSDTPTWIEWDLDGNPIGQWNLKSDFGIAQGYAHAYAYTADGRLYAQVFNPSLKQHMLWMFNRATSTWQPSAGAPDSVLMGSDRNSLVFRGKSSAPGIPLVRTPAP